MLIAPNFPWHRADSPEEQLALSKEFGLTPKSYVHPKPLIYRDMDGNIVPCTLVGSQSGRYAIIEIGDALHTIHADCLADMQGAAPSCARPVRSTRSSTSKPPVWTGERPKSSNSVRCALRTARRPSGFPCSCSRLRPCRPSARS